MMRRNTSFSTNYHGIVYTKLVQLYTFKLTASFLKGKLASIVYQSIIEYFAITLQFVECVVCGVRQCATGNYSISTCICRYIRMKRRSLWLTVRVIHFDCFILGLIRLLLLNSNYNLTLGNFLTASIDSFPRPSTDSSPPLTDQSLLTLLLLDSPPPPPPPPL